MQNALIKSEKENLILLLRNANAPKGKWLILEAQQSVTLTQCLQSPVIRSLEKEMDVKEILQFIRSTILQTAKAFKFSENMDMETASLLATDMHEAFRYDTIQDILLMLKMARQGKLGSGKGRLDHDIMFNLFIPTYFELKAEAREKKMHNEKAERESIKIEDPEQHKKNLKKLDAVISKLQTSKETSQPEFVPIDHHQLFLSKLPTLVLSLTNSELKKEMQKALSANMKDTYLIYKQEAKNRNI